MKKKTRKTRKNTEYLVENMDCHPGGYKAVEVVANGNGTETRTARGIFHEKEPLVNCTKAHDRVDLLTDCLPNA